MPHNHTAILYDHIRFLNSAMQTFQYQPTEQHRAALTATMKNYREAVSRGLAISRAIPPPLEPADNLSDYYRRELNEAMIQFKALPEDGWEALDRLTTGYIKAVQQGKIRP
ncbi:hypothetical protein [Gallionella capsiferriformans]|uniref:NADP-dependent malic enzyme-like n=1 Tax=Gallionella capsiferriformans (strain ES-2) TaxID=395494 RepID=D9SH10_GALCS|nr:hypothetical protein [Gallionella capsiferriformans]ADL55807.1 NADP-dependent malic enzyme-like [Gallionella capsiferriformans ES-2]